MKGKLVVQKSQVKRHPKPFKLAIPRRKAVKSGKKS